ncbi:MAG TPA: DoxX family protein [Pyrinomonadaceae bacterium]|nr:DoxX family protein [Pyrinomonadaceae bacterium]
MDRYLGRYSAYVYAILRIVSGFVFVLYGTQKFFGYPPNPPGMPTGPLSTLLTVAGAIELVAGLMIMFGFFAGLAAFIASGEMAVAYFMVNQQHGTWPPTNGGTATVLFCFVFLYIAARGSGVWSVDSLRGAGAQPL